jgi:hypothetical protein
MWAGFCKEQTVLNALVRAVFVVSAAILAVGLMAFGLLVAAVLLTLFLLRRGVARLFGRPQPPRPDFRFATQAWPRRQQQPRAPAAEVVDVQVREIR